MRHLKLKLAAVAASALALGACASPKPVAVEPSSLQAEVQESLAKAASQAAEAQATLARIQVARTKPAPSSLDETALPEELKRPATLDWSGPAHEAARRIAALIGYQFQVVGNQPSIPPMIHVSLTDVPAAKALEQIGLQSSPFGEVSLDPNVKRVEFRYLQAQHQQPQNPRGTSPSLRGASK